MNAKTPKPKSSFDTFLIEWNLPSLHESVSTPPPLPPKFPSFTELVRLDAETPATNVEDRGLFAALIGRPEALYEDAVEHPEKYNTETLVLLTDLASGVKKLEGLSREERRLLDLGTLDFAAATRKVKRPRPTAPQVAPRATSAAPADPVPGVDIPAGAGTPYWWLK